MAKPESPIIMSQETSCPMPTGRWLMANSGSRQGFYSAGFVGTEASVHQFQRKPRSSAPQNRKARAANRIAGPFCER